MPKTKNRKYTKKIKRKAGTLQSFRDMRSALRDLDRRGIPGEVSDIIFREFAASKIQDKSKEKNLQRLTAFLARIYNPLYLKELQLTAFVNSVNTSYEFNTSNTPSVLLQILPQVNNVLMRIRHILRFHNEPQFLRAEFREVGFFALRTFLLNTILEGRRIDTMLADYRANMVADYNMAAQYGIETQPGMRNYTTRRTDAIVRPPRTARAQAITRRTRSY
jgi:hypothetical protein